MTAASRTGNGLRVSHVTGLYLITALCGLVDAAFYLGLDRVFAEMMTGNLLLFCFYLGTGDSILQHGGYLVALAAFAIGAASGGRILRSRYGASRLGFTMEWIVLALAVVLSVTLPVASSQIARTSIIGLLAFALGLQNALVRKHGVPDLATNVMTLTYTAFVADSSLGGGQNERWQRRLGSIAVFMVGAALGAVLTNTLGPWAALLAGLIVFSVALTGLTRQRPPG